MSLSSGWHVHPGHNPAAVRWLNTKEQQSFLYGLTGGLWCSSPVCCFTWKKRMHSAMHIFSLRPTLQDTEWCKDGTEIFFNAFPLLQITSGLKAVVTVPSHHWDCKSCSNSGAWCKTGLIKSPGPFQSFLQEWHFQDLVFCFKQRESNNVWQR